MKKLTKVMLASGGALLLGAGAVTNYLLAQQPQTAQEELTLANLEAMAFLDPEELDMEPGPGDHVNYEGAANYYCIQPVGARGCGDRANSICTIGTFCNEILIS